MEFGGYEVYGYITATLVKILLINGPQDGGDVMEALQALHGAFVDALQNPFQSPEKEITSEVFRNRVDVILKSS